jgi:hypothetical protein
MSELYDAILTMSRDDFGKSLDKFSEIWKISGRQLFQAIATEAGFKVVKESAYVMQSLVLCYYNRALENQKQGDDLSSLTYSASASGINAVLATAFIPILRRNASNYGCKEEIEHIQKINEYVGQQIDAVTMNARGNISSKDQQRAKRRLDESTQTMINLAINVTFDVRTLAVALSKRFAAGDFKQARRLYEYVRDEITYIHDPLGIEEIQRPETTLKMGAGDCDDKAVLLGALLKSIGFETCFFIADTDNDSYADHVYIGVYLPEAPELYKPLQRKRLPDGRDLHDWVPLDPTYEDSDFGVIPLTDVGILEYLPIAGK